MLSEHIPSDELVAKQKIVTLEKGDTISLKNYYNGIVLLFDEYCINFSFYHKNVTITAGIDFVCLFFLFNPLHI